MNAQSSLATQAGHHSSTVEGTKRLSPVLCILVFCELVYVCVCVSCVHLVTKTARRGVTEELVTNMWVLGTDPGLLQDKEAFLKAMPSFQPCKMLVSQKSLMFSKSFGFLKGHLVSLAGHKKAVLGASVSSSENVCVPGASSNHMY